MNDQAHLIRSLTKPSLHDSACTEVRVIETHISYVLLTGRYAYKIKKAVNLGFLDFTTLAARHYYCERELELNRRLAPSLYLRVVAITGTVDRPSLVGDGPAIEYAVQMREFPQDGLLTRLLERGDLTAAHIDALASTVAAFHASASAMGKSRVGSAPEILALAIENFAEMDPLVGDGTDRRRLATLRQWTGQEHGRLAPNFEARQRTGFVRECHGDLHLGNIALVDGSVTIFDCIEFNDKMRWSDVMADVGFVVMDLHDRGRPDFAARFLNAYLERTGDYEGVRVLRFYVVYRAMVRAKVAYMRARQTEDPKGRAAKAAEGHEYLELAGRCTTAAPAVVITHGVTGAGKTTGSQSIVESIGAIRIRTDVERKRLYGLTARAHSGSALNAGLYSREGNERTCARLIELARAVVAGGYPVIVDGTFLRRTDRDRFRRLADDLDVRFAIADFVAPIETLRARVRRRQEAASDASEADLHVLEYQLQAAEPLTAGERELTVTGSADADPGETARLLAARCSTPRHSA